MKKEKRYMALCLSCFLSVFFLISLGLEAQREPLTLTWENIFTQNYGASRAALSPNGKWVAITASTPEQRGIFLKEVESGAQAQFWISGSSPSWFADGRRIVYSNKGDLWTIGIGEITPKRLTSDTLDERAPKPSPDGKYVAFYSGRSGFQDIWMVPSDGSAEAKQLTIEAMALDDFRFYPSWSPDSRKIAYYSFKGDYWEDDIWVVDVATGEERQVSKNLMAMSTPIWSPDGSQIALFANAKDEYWYEDLSYIYLIDPKAGTDKKLKMQVHATDLLFNHTVSWSGDGSELFFPYQERSEVELWRVSSQGGVATRVTNMGGTFFNYHATPSADAFVFVRSTSTRGNDVDYIKVEGGLPRRLTNFSTEWQGLLEPEEISYRSWDGLYIQGFVYYPHNFDAGNKYPALVHVHGGGTNTYYKRLSLNEQYMAQKGYVVIAVNYRGGSGFDRPFQDLSINDWGNGQAKDAAFASNFIRSQPWSNGKVGIYGYSYGGITSMAAITRVPDAFDAAVPMAGIYDFGDAYTNADRIGKIFTKTGHGGSPDERPEIYKVSNALSRVEKVKTPLLIMHGEADVRAPFRQYELAVKILKEKEKTFESKSYPNEPHGFRNPQNRVDMYNRLEAWFKKWL
ncbi:S9 family peptidase [Croceitalea rosinachiae]|uniref:Prolyl oligopeptidase family serine peptidase n=1 Tax=Croceitalea rosinachiae TaxID=3075596 RepID=A0ABU3ACV3_9FLAO|nr:prolyl oligopeptidase family serine peptidase [Croceitalea sp. F388]MDT0608006.1 prolyl oligopeptidase family serine peptidase [Croceitalea sp. F388]